MEPPPHYVQHIVSRSGGRGDPERCPLETARAARGHSVEGSDPRVEYCSRAALTQVRPKGLTLSAERGDVGAACSYGPLAIVFTTARNLEVRRAQTTVRAP